MKVTQLLLGLKNIILATLWTVLITTLSLVSSVDAPDFVTPIPFKDKIVHFTFYFVFVLLWSYSLQNKIINYKIKILLAAIFYGIVIEVLQDVVTTSRTADFYDVLANSFGALVAFFVFPYLKNTFLQ